MEIDYKYIVPLLGVTLGWFLNGMGSVYRDGIEKKKVIGNLIKSFIRVQRQVNHVIIASEEVKDLAENWSEYEPIRVTLIKKYLMSTEDVVEGLGRAIDAYAAIDPIAAIRVQDIYDGLIRFKNSKLSESSKRESAYVAMLSINEVFLEATQKGINIIIGQLALKHGVITYVRYRYDDYRYRKNKNIGMSSMEIYLSKIREELKSHIEEERCAQNKGSTE
jgi:hypothetical protein